MNIDEFPTEEVPSVFQGRNQTDPSVKEMPALPLTPSPFIPVLLERQKALLFRRTMTSLEAIPTRKQPSPELAQLLKHREQVARIQTQQMQAVVVAAPAQGQEQPTNEAVPTTPLPAQPKKPAKKGIFHSRKRVPVLQQISIVECGAACLAMLLSYHGRKTTVSEVREQCGVGRDGLTALSIVKAACKYGMRVRALSLQENDFRYVSLPAIVHWEFNHFLVVERWSAKSVDVVDPASGRKSMSAKEFDEGFTCIVISIEPSVQFARENNVSQLTLSTYAKDYIKQAPKALVQVFVASLLLQLLGLIFPLLSEVAIDQLIPAKMVNALQLFGIGLILLVLAQVITRLLRALILLYLQSRVDIRLMFNFLEHLLSPGLCASIQIISCR